MKFAFVLVAAACALTAPALAQLVDIDPGQTKAHLVNNSTSVSLALRNRSNSPAPVSIQLNWLDTSDKIQKAARHDTTVPSGASTVEIPLPLDPARDPYLYRLEYRVQVVGQQIGNSLVARGILNFVNIAEHAFVLQLVGGNTTRPEAPYELHVLAMHPVTTRPASGVRVFYGSQSVRTGQDGMAVLHLTPPPGDMDPHFLVSAELGDLHREMNTSRLPMPQAKLLIHTDKPLYQPGQMLHIRLLARTPAGKASADAEMEVAISTADGDKLYTTQVKTSRFGIASIDWQIPLTAKQGKYEIEAEPEDGDSVTRTVTIRPYELPSFHVTATLDQPYYLPGRTAQLRVSAAYLFGKPVTAGTVRITESDDGQPILQGSLDTSGVYKAELPTNIELVTSQFIDKHYVAYLTDASTNRTEKQPFDLRISRDALHLYVAKIEATPEGARVYATVYSPDGAPRQTTVAVKHGDRVLATGTTNGLGLARLDVKESSLTNLSISAITDTGRAVEQLMQDIPESPALWLETDRRLYRSGQAIHCRILQQAPAPLLLMAWNKQGELVYSQSLSSAPTRTDLAIPYSPRFGGALTIGVAAIGAKDTAARTVLFPGVYDFAANLTPGKSTYRPGDTATLSIATSKPAAIGLAVLDQSVRERAAADGLSTSSPFAPEDLREQSISGLTASSLAYLDPNKITPDLQLAAEVLLEDAGLLSESDSLIENQRNVWKAASAKALSSISQRLDSLYARTLDYPRDEASFFAAVHTVPLDPWLRPYYPKFHIEGADHVLCLHSDGPDQRPNTADDYCGLTIRRNWFAPLEALIRERLRTVPDYPTSAESFAALLKAGGLHLDEWRDPWGQPVRLNAKPLYRQQNVSVTSAGPDRTFGTADDVVAASFNGPFFTATTTRINTALAAVTKYPSDQSSFETLLKSHGLDFAALRDPWGHPYIVQFHQEYTYGSSVRIYSYAEYQGRPEQRTDTTPIRRLLDVIEIRSIGEDGLPNTYDDFEVATFSHEAQPAVASTDTSPTSTLPASSIVGGTGTIEGVVTDPSGGVLPRANATLNDLYATHTDENGHYVFRALPPGTYHLRLTMPGFQSSVIDSVPVSAGKITRVDSVLQLGTVSEAVQVTASVNLLQTQSATLSSKGPAILATPRVREYFPETLYWAPELLTDKTGHTTVNVKLADSITTWQVALIASTEDGQISQSTTEIRAFQPFQVDLDVPPVLTMGDQIDLPVPVRNYLAQAQKVQMGLTLSPELQLREPLTPIQTVSANASANSLLRLTAAKPAPAAKLQVTARAVAAADAIVKPVTIHPDGAPQENAEYVQLKTGQPLKLDLHTDAIAGTLHLEARIYPSLLARLLDASESILRRPYGCAEQTISSSYPNLLFLKALQTAKLTDEHWSTKARANLTAGYQRLLGYQSPDGGFGYWSGSTPDMALTGYAIAFLEEAREWIQVDESHIEAARDWMEGQHTNGVSDTLLQSAALARRGSAGTKTGIAQQLRNLTRLADETNNPYWIALLIRASVDAGEPAAVTHSVELLRALAEEKQGLVSWGSRETTPFHGWGPSGRIETTAIAIDALAAWRTSQRAADPSLDALLHRAGLYLLKNAQSGSVWGSTQATARALNALLTLAAAAPQPAQGASYSLTINGKSAGQVTPTLARHAVGLPIVLDLTSYLRPGQDNQLTLTGPTGPSTHDLQLITTWYRPWKTQPPSSSHLAFFVQYSSTQATTNSAIICQVKALRPAGGRYGMMIAEVGLPPGADVDRSSLSALLKNRESGVDSFEVAPDHVTFYVWPRRVESNFQFSFRPLFSLQAQSAPSLLYDYYNPDERALLAPTAFVIKE